MTENETDTKPTPASPEISQSQEGKIPATPSKPAASPWPRRLLWVGVALVVLGAAGYGLLTLGLTRALESNKLRESIAQKTAFEVRADTGYLPIRARGLTLLSDGAAAHGAPPAPLSDLQARGLQARCNLRGLWHRVWKIEELRIERLQAAYGEAAAAKYVEHDLPNQPKLEPPVDGHSPIRVDILRTEIARVDLSWGKTGQDLGGLLGVKTRCLLAGKEGKELDVQGEGGRFQQAGFPELAIDQLRLHYAKPELRIEQGRLSQPEKNGGDITTKGQIRFEGSTPLEISLAFSRCGITPFLPKNWHGKLEGRFGGEATVRKELNNEKPVDVQGELELNDGVLQGLAALDKIAALTRHDRFRHLPLRSIHARFHYEDGKLRVTDFRAESKGLVCVEGSFSIDKKRIRGSFQLGAVAEVLDTIPGAREKVFTRARDGYLWTPVKLTGPADEPRDDLRPRLVKAAEEQIAQGLLAPILIPGKEILELLRRL